MSGRIGVLDGLRGIAIAGVMLIHLLYASVWLEPERFGMQMAGLTLSPQTVLTNAGTGGVTLFFILSGFVLALPYVRGQRMMRSPPDVRRFWRRRARRLLPLFFAGALAALLLSSSLVSGAGDVLLLLTGLYAWLPSEAMPAVNPVLWSIGTEWWLSLAFPALLALQLRWGSARTLALAVSVAAAGRLWAAGFAEAGGSVDAFKLPPMRLDDFVLGMVLADAYVRGALPGRSHALLGLGMVLFGFVLWDGVRAGLHPQLALVANHLLIGVGLTLVTGALLRHGSRAGRLVSATPLRRLGILCYSLYVWHIPLQWLIAPLGSPARFGLYLLALAGTALLSYRWIEFPDRPFALLFVSRRPGELPVVGHDPAVRHAEEVQAVPA